MRPAARASNAAQRVSAARSKPLIFGAGREVAAFVLWFVGPDDTLACAEIHDISRVRRVK